MHPWVQTARAAATPLIAASDAVHGSRAALMLSDILDAKPDSDQGFHPHVASSDLENLCKGAQILATSSSGHNWLYAPALMVAFADGSALIAASQGLGWRFVPFVWRIRARAPEAFGFTRGERIAVRSMEGPKHRGKPRLAVFSSCWPYGDSAWAVAVGSHGHFCPGTGDVESLYNSFIRDINSIATLTGVAPRVSRRREDLGSKALWVAPFQSLNWTNPAHRAHEQAIMAHLAQSLGYAGCSPLSPMLGLDGLPIWKNLGTWETSTERQDLALAKAFVQVKWPGGTWASLINQDKHTSKGVMQLRPGSLYGSCASADPLTAHSRMALSKEAFA